MNARNSAKVRIELARGHWSLGERDEAMVALERLAAENPEADELEAVVGDFISEAQASAEDASYVLRLTDLRERIEQAREASKTSPHSPLATPTMAALLASQGHQREAIALADDLVRRNPDDERAREVLERLSSAASSDDGVIETLERWLSNIQRVRRGDASA